MIRSALPARGLAPHFLVTFLFATVCSSTSWSQCIGPDNMNGACCQTVTPALPPFPGIQLMALGVCWTNCVPSQQVPIRVDVQPPALIGCTQYAAPITVFETTNGNPILAGKLILDYTRTFDEMDPNGVFHQVWRFAAKADFSSIPGVPQQCPMPACTTTAGAQPTSFYYGYIDFVQPCVVGAQMESVVVLYHACDFFIHRPGISSRPGVFHPNESYAIIAPVTSAQPFVPGISPASSGVIIDGATRDTPPLVPPICLSNDFIFTGQMTQLGGACLCPPANAPKQHRFRQFAGQTACPVPSGVPGNFQSVNIGFPNLLPWFHLMTTSLGSWTNNNIYPGAERAFVDEGLFLLDQGCTGPLITIEYGGSTRGGWMILHPVLFSGVTDLASNYALPLGTVPILPIMGQISTTDHLIFVNTP